MELLIFSAILSVFTMILFYLNKKLSFSSKKEVCIGYLGDEKYLKKALEGKEKTSGELPDLLYYYFQIFVVNRLVRRKIKKGETLENVEKAYVKIYGAIKENASVKRKNFANLLYVNGFCRVVIVARSVLEITNYNLTSQKIDKIFKENNIRLTKSELENLKGAFNYQLVIEYGKMARYILHLNNMKNKAKNGKDKYCFSKVFVYFFGKHTDNFEDFESKIKTYFESYENAMREYEKLNIFYLKKALKIVRVIKYLKTFEPIKLSICYGILAKNGDFRGYEPNLQGEIIAKIEEIANKNNVDEERVAKLTITLSRKNLVSPFELLFNRVDLVSRVLNCKKKRKKVVGN